MQEVKDAHMITGAYLKAWANTNNDIDVVDLEDGHIRRASVKKATTVEYAYRPAVLGHDLEGEYGRVESQGVPAIVKLRQGDPLSPVERTRLVAFLDMHLDRGRYADQAKLTSLGIALGMDGTLSPIELNMADRIALSQFLPEVTRLRDAGAADWEWQVRETRTPLITGDGAVLLWRQNEPEGLAGVSFPLSPTQLLVIGPAPHTLPSVNGLVQSNSKRWLVGTRGTFVGGDNANRAARRARKARPAGL